MVEAATIPANVSIEDLRSGADATSVTVTLTNAQVLGMYAAPVELLPAPDANSMYQLTGATLVNLNTGVAYASGGVLIVQYGSTVHGAGTDALSGTVAATFLTSPTATQVITVGGNVTTTAGSATLGNGIYISNQTGAFTSGTGTLQVLLNFVKIDT